MLSQDSFDEAKQDGHQPPLPSNLDHTAEASFEHREVPSVQPGVTAESPFMESTPSHPKPHSVTSCLERKPLAKLCVGKPFKGKEVLRPITYFPISVEVLVKNDGHFTAPDVPMGSHHRHINMGIKRNEWTRNSCATVERRYKELMELREILMHQFPNIVIPPLPDKDSVNHIETYFNAEDQLSKQRCNMQFFLSEIAAMPEIVFFSEWIPSFFLDARETFETSTLIRMRATLNEMRLANKTVDQFKQRNCTFVEYTTNKIAKKSTKIVRSLAGLLWGDDAESVVHGVDHRSSALPSQNERWSALPMDLQEDAKAWEAIAEVLDRRQGFFRKAAKGFEAFLNSKNNCNAEQIKTASAMMDYEATLRKAECFSQLAEHFHNASSMLSDIAEKERQLADKRYLNVCMRLRFEYSYIDSVLNAIDHVLSMYRSLASDVYDVKDAFYFNNLKYTRAISEGLMRDYNERYRQYYVQRMRNLLSEQIARPTLELASVIEETMQRAPFLSSIRQNDFMNC
ncbi:unnamed protein product [Phytomonas sp. EM1]|nr:unnamed protein product [Phytomonas sp. EM1]|eukprot:CCW64050.1 unnamed protein product [Phytomonas sp. isolate EM1]